MNDLSPIANLSLILDNRLKAKFLYWLGWKITDIADATGEKERTISAWKAREKWEEEKPENRIEEALVIKLTTLILKNKKTSGDIKEIDLLMRQYERFARIEKYRSGGAESDLNPNLQQRAIKKKQKANHFDEEQVEMLIDAFEDEIFDYQRTWYEAGTHRTRFILKSRQIGATWYFAREALVDAIKTGRNQIFLSASKRQAHIFKKYIQQFAKKVCGVELSGDPIVLSNDAQLIFLGTNYHTAQGESGNLYFDEIFWTHGFEQLRSVAAAMATHEHWRLTYFSTPSSKAHEGYDFWTGSWLNKDRPKSEHIKVDVSHDHLQKGRLCSDGMWRQIVTVQDAENGGCDLFNIERLKRENNAERFNNLFMCEFIDDNSSLFNFSLLHTCMVDSWELWEKDYKPYHTRPFGNKEVWLGYDPALSGDSAGLVIVAPPDNDYKKFRVLEHHQLKGDDFAQQAEFIRQMTIRYKVTYIGIDTTGMGTGVAQLVRQFASHVTEFQYSPDVKSRLVMKTMDVIRKGRLEYDTGASDLSQSLMSIKRVLTKSQKQVTYMATRSEETGHADLAWALMHALHNEPLEGQNTNNKSTLEIYE